MKKEIILRKFEGYVDKINDALDNISTLLEIDNDDDELSEMSVIFREQVTDAINENTECNYEDITSFIRENL